jgi:cell division protein FtsL
VKFKKTSVITKIVIAVLIIYAVVSLVTVKSKTTQARQQTDSLQKKVTQMTEANAELQYGIDHSTDEKTIEDIAREKLGLVKPGEIIFYDAGN